jgi:hypothetical protein
VHGLRAHGLILTLQAIACMQLPVSGQERGVQIDASSG